MPTNTRAPGHAAQNASHPAGLPTVEQISLKQISAFLAVVELQNMTKAAERLHMSQSGLSRVIGTLEGAVGESLFIRSASGLALSSTGSAFLPHAQNLHARYSAAIAVARGDTNRSNDLMVACTDVVLPMLLPEFMALSRQGARGGFRWRVVGMKSYQVVSQVESGGADFGLCMTINGAETLGSIPLLKAPLGLLVAPSMRLPDAMSSLASLNRVPMARLSDQNVLPGFLGNRIAQLDAYFNAPVVAGTIASLFAAVRLGNVATIVSGFSASLPHASGLRFVPLPELFPSIQLLLVYRNNQAPPRRDTGPVHRLARAVQQIPWSNGVECVLPAPGSAP